MTPNNSKNNQDDKDLWLQRKANRSRTHFSRRPSAKERSRESLMRDWFGAVMGANEVMAHQRPSQPIDKVVGNVLASFGMREMLLLDRVRIEWPELVGGDVAKYAWPAALQGRTLQVEVANSTWRYVLEREHKGAILLKIKNQYEGKIDKVRFVPPGRFNNPQG